MVYVHNPRLKAALATFLALALAGCPTTGVSPPPASLPGGHAAVAPVRWRVSLARGQSAYVPIDLPVATAGGRVLITPSEATISSLVWSGTVEVFAAHEVRGAVQGPAVEQLTGRSRGSADAGTWLEALRAATDSADGAFELSGAMPLYARVTVPPTMEAGEYRITVRLEAPGGPVESGTLVIDVSDLAVPTAPRVLAVATTNVDELSRIYPETFGTIGGQYLDPADPDHKAGARQLDGLIQAARSQGVALFVEDIMPALHLDELGQVTLDWDAYDRLLQPYMDGSAFADRVPLGVWLMPLPPKRIADAGTQLRQYIELCTKHFAAKRWSAVPAFLHPALTGAGGDAGADSEKLRAQVGMWLYMHLSRDVLAVAAPGADLPHGQLWTVNDGNPRLPPVGALADEFSVRAWPWLCVARGNLSGAGGIGGSGGTPTGVKGLVWRHAVRGAEASGSTADAGAPSDDLALLVARPDGVFPTRRMVWLNEGLNDAALLGLLERRADSARTGMMSEILAGMIGRTGVVGGEPPPDPAGAFVAPTGYLYAGWPADKALWEQATPNLLKLIQASDPGSRAQLKPDDPAYLAAKLWLAGTRRPVARIAGYDLSLRPGTQGGDVLEARLHLRVENPIDVPAAIDFHFPVLPGDFEMGLGTTAPAATLPIDETLRRQRVNLPPSSLADVPLPLAGHIAALMEAPPLQALEITERFNGAVLRLPVRLPVYRTRSLEAGQAPPKMDGVADDWPLDTQTRVFGEMKVAARYLARPDLLSGALRQDEKPATLRWTYDADYLYLLARCPQDSISDDRNSDWPLRPGSGGGSRWWGADGLQIELATMPGANIPDDVANRLLKIAFKPSGVALVRTGMLRRDNRGVASLTWKEGAPPLAGAPGLKYGITIERDKERLVGYTLEAAIPRAWIEAPENAATKPATGPAASSAAWRLNVLRHRTGELVSSSWSGPIVDDDDVAMMGALIGQ
jgi:hypothetical protein